MMFIRLAHYEGHFIYVNPIHVVSIIDDSTKTERACVVTLIDDDAPQQIMGSAWEVAQQLMSKAQ